MLSSIQLFGVKATQRFTPDQILIIYGMIYQYR